MPVKHTITLDASDIRSAIGDVVKRQHPDLCKNKIISIRYTVERPADPNSITAHVTFDEIRPDPRD